MLSEAQRKAVPQAAARALNRTAQQASTAAVRTLAKETGLKQKDVREKVARIRAARNKLEAVIIATGRAFNLIRFKAKQTKKGVKASAWGRRKLYKGTFIANKGRTVFKRVGKNRKDIKPVHGPRIPREFVQQTNMKAMKDVASKRWPINFSADLKYYLSKIK